LQYFCALALLALSQSAWSISVSQSPGYAGNYTVSWDTTLGCTWEDYPPFYPEHCYSLLENGVEIAGSGNSLPVTGKPPGSYTYQVYYRMTVYGQPYDEYTVEGPVTVQVEGPPPSSEQQEYVSRHGDVDGDGDIDLYVKRVAGTSWQLPIAELLLRRNANGTFNVETSVSQATRDIVNQWGISVTLPKLVDFNVDGYFDLFIQGLPLANVGPYDVVVFASNGPGAPPVSARLIDESVKKFATDTLAYLEDPNYFNSAYQYSCIISWSWYPAWRRDIDGYYYWYQMPYPGIDCYLVPNPNFSYAAVQAAPSVAYMFETGRLQAGNYNALVIEYYLGQLFGTTYMGGALSSGAGFFPLGGSFGEALETRRAAEAIGALMQLYIALAEETPATLTGPHSFHWETPICQVGVPACTLDHIFSKMLEIPVWGYAVPAPGSPNPCGDLHRGRCTVPVQNNDRTMVEIGEKPSADDDMGLVVHTVDPSQHVLVNTTLEGHIFHEGTVTRRAVIGEDGILRIVTDGSGTGAYPQLNTVFGPAVFLGVDLNVMERALTP